jgi:hypothetical protein
MATIHLNGHHRKALASIFRHPPSHNVEWHDVLSLLGHLGTTRELHDGGYEVIIGTERFVLARPHDKDVQGEELSDLRKFLTKVGLTPVELAPESHPADAPAKAPDERHCIVLIDHQQARLFGLDDDPASPRVIKPEDPDGSRRRVEHRQGGSIVDGAHDGGHSAEEDSYYEQVSADLKPAQRIVVFSDGKGRSNAGDYLIGYLKHLHPAVAERIVASERIDIAHTSDGQVVAAGLALLKTA